MCHSNKARVAFSQGTYSCQRREFRLFGKYSISLSHLKDGQCHRGGTSQLAKEPNYGEVPAFISGSHPCRQSIELVEVLGNPLQGVETQHCIKRTTVDTAFSLDSVLAIDIEALI